MKEKSERLRELLLSPMGLIGALTVVILMLLIVFSVIRTMSNNQASGEVTTYEYDPASQTEIVNSPITNGDYVELPIYVGFTEILNNGMTGLQMNVMKDTIEKYGKSVGLDLMRVSYLKDSYSLGGIFTFDFTVVLNIDEKALKVRVDSSKGLKDILGMKVILWDEDDKEVYKLEITEDSICDYVEGCDESDPET